MALTAKYLIDTSAAARMRNAEVAARLEPLIEAGLVATSASLDAEAFYSTRSPKEYEQRWESRRIAYEYLATQDEHWQAALQAQRGLARGGRHRAVGIGDLLTAVLAAEHRLVVIHYDADFEIASEVVEFRQQWVVPRGTV
ncbi:MAG: PIN domain-containing protein [Candidatus Nanopelagicales bacterium]